MEVILRLQTIRPKLQLPADKDRLMEEDIRLLSDHKLKATDAGLDKVLTATGPDGVVTQNLKHLDVSESAEMLGV